MPNLNLFRRRAEAERKAAKARLAAVETAGMIHRDAMATSAQDRAAAIARVKKVAQWPDMSDEEAGGVVDWLLQHLRDSPLNVNMKASDFFEGESGDKYTTKFEVRRTAGAPFNETRNTAEERMFHYGTAKPGSSGQASSDPGAVEAAERAKAIGPITSPGHHGMIRPRYVSLNFARLCDGFGAQWGRTHFVFAEHLKHNATFIHTDSFDAVGGDKALVGGKMVPVTPETSRGQVCSYHDMTRLIVNMADSLLDCLLDAASGALVPGLAWEAVSQRYGNFGKTAYLEGHVHAEIFFNRDVQKLRVCNAEVTTPKIRSNIDAFGAKHKVAVEYFD